ncbi:MAG: lasso peptide biosynthesis B2 protein [Gemmatimonadales bacterium]
MGLGVGGNLRLLVTGLVVPPLVRLVPLDRLADRLGRRRRVYGDAWHPLVAHRVDSLLGRLPPPWRRTCLTRSTVLYHLLGRPGGGVELCIGVRQEEGGMAAHAWLERNGEPYLEAAPDECRSYEVIARFSKGR